MRQIAPARVSARLFARASRSETGCLISGYSERPDDGYSQIGWHEDGRLVVMLAHRVAWAATYGPIPEGVTVDHRCHVRMCLEPTHLRLLTHEANSARWDGDWPLEWSCKRNHGPEHRFVNSAGHHECRLCARMRKDRWRERQSA